MSIWLIIILLLIILIVLYTAVTYSGLVKGKKSVLEASSAIDIQLNHRNDLIPNLLETVNKYASNEKIVLGDVSKTRDLSQATLDSNADLDEKLAASNDLTSALSRLTTVTEAYPDLKDNADFDKSMKELSNAEDKISYTRQMFNSNSINFNNSIQQFPENLVAQGFKFTSFKLLKTNEEEKTAPKANFKA
ncbi:LemA family protein [Oenococcus sp. UCMA 16435]|nr:LemA family protein [Oenococcus sp. UCMA 16435]